MLNINYRESKIGQDQKLEFNFWSHSGEKKESYNQLNDFKVELVEDNIVLTKDKISIIEKWNEISFNSIFCVSKEQALYFVKRIMCYVTPIRNLLDIQIGENIRNITVTFITNKKVIGFNSCALKTNNELCYISTSNSVGGIITLFTPFGNYAIYANNIWIKNEEITFPDDNDYIVTENTLNAAPYSNSEWTFADTIIYKK